MTRWLTVAAFLLVVGSGSSDAQSTAPVDRLALLAPLIG
jgi:hypothetical protein